MPHKTDYRPEFWSPARGRFFGPICRTPQRYWDMIGKRAIDVEPVGYHGWSNRIWALIKWSQRLPKSHIVRDVIRASIAERKNLTITDESRKVIA